MADEQRTVWTTNAVGQRLGYDESAIRKMCEAGRFPGAYRNGVGGHWRIPDGDVLAFIEERRPKRRKVGQR
jgi:hypothetical protein